MKRRKGSFLWRTAVLYVTVAFFLQSFPTIQFIKFIVSLSGPGYEICQLSEDCTCPAATCQCDHGNDVFFSRYTDIQNGSASLSNNTTVTPVSGLTVTTCPAHRYHADSEMASISRFVLTAVPEIIYLPNLRKILDISEKKPLEISPPEIFHPPQNPV